MFRVFKVVPSEVHIPDLKRIKLLTLKFYNMVYVEAWCYLVVNTLNSGSGGLGVQVRPVALFLFYQQVYL